MKETKAHIADTQPAKVKLKAGESVLWCGCGLSRRQPFCDGSHRWGLKHAAKTFTAEKDGVYFFCQCKHSSTAPLCDGSHKLITREMQDMAHGLRRETVDCCAMEDLQEAKFLHVEFQDIRVFLSWHDGRVYALRASERSCGNETLSWDSDGEPWLHCPGVEHPIHATSGRISDGSPFLDIIEHHLEGGRVKVDLLFPL